MPRLFYIDNIRALMIILVIFIHAAVTYSGMGSWYYKEDQPLDAPSFIFFGFIQSWTQAYFMGALFFIAGYFTVDALKRKPKNKFIVDRIIRLGIPTTLYILIIHYLNQWMLGIAPNYTDYLRSGLELISNTGPMWFALALLIFSITYALTYKTKTQTKQTNTTKTIILLAAATFLTRTTQPIDTSILNMQLPYFPQYIILFILGTIAFKQDWLSQPNIGGKHILRNTLLIGLPLWFLILGLSGVLEGKTDFKGGFNLASFAYSLWEALVCIGITYGLIGLMKERYNVQTKITKYFTDNSFAVYVLHPPVLIGISLMMKNWTAPPIAKFLAIGMIATIATFLIAGVVRKTPMKRIL